MSTRSPHLRFGLVIAAIAFVLDQAAKWIVTIPLERLPVSTSRA